MAVITCTRERVAGATVVSECEHGVHLAAYEGATLGTREMNGYDDSDFYALVWTGTELTEMMYATTRGWTYHNGAVADATDEVKQAARRWLAYRDIRAAYERSALDACTVEKGKQVEVTGGQKHLGATGTVFWLGQCRYGKGYRVGLRTESGEKLFLAEEHVTVTGAWQHLASLAEIRRSVIARLQRVETAGQFVSAYHSDHRAIDLSTRRYARREQAAELIDAECLLVALESVEFEL